MKTLSDVDVRGKRVLLRVDFNVAMEEEEIKEDFRLRAVVPTIQYLLAREARVILLSHLGRPEGKENKKLTLRPAALRLQEMLERPVRFVEDCIGKRVKAEIDKTEKGDIIMCENLRFYLGEEANDEDFAKKLAELGDIYVNDAFGAAHRAHASIVGIPKLLPSAAGLLLQQETQELGRLRENPEHPFVVLLGGAKVKTKIKVVEALINRADAIGFGGILANTILAAKNVAIGESLYEKEVLEYLDNVAITDTKMHLPVDVVVSQDSTGRKPVRISAVGSVGDNEMILDIGPDTVELFADVLRRAKTIVWNGPMGMFEKEPFSRGTYGLARVLKELDAYVVVGGGDVIRAVDEVTARDAVDYVSTGGGAMLEYLAEGTLPGIEALQKK